MLEVELGGQVMEAYKTTYDKILEETRKTVLAEGRAEGRAEGEAKGRAEGRAEGEAKGRAEGRAEILRKLLTLKFGPLSIDSEDRLRKASLAELDLWTERVLTAGQIQDIFGPTY